MYIGIISDAHGNVLALKHCLSVLKKLGANKILYLGDALGYFHQASAVCQTLMQVEALCLMGNHEAIYLGYIPQTAQQEELMQLKNCKNIPSKWLHSIEKQGPFYAFELNEKRIVCVHATPCNPLEGRYFSLVSPLHDIDIIFTGHSHRALIRQSFLKQKGRVTTHVNVGSCGSPRDYGTLLSVALFNTKTLTTQIWRIPFSFPQDLLQNAHDDVVKITKRKNSFYVGEVLK